MCHVICCWIAIFPEFYEKPLVKCWLNTSGFSLFKKSMLDNERWFNVLCIQQQFHLYITEWVLLPLCCKCTLEIGWHIVTPVLFLSKILTQWENSGQVGRRCRMINPVGHLEDSSWWLWWGLFRGPAECLSCYINEDFWKTEKLWRGYMSWNFPACHFAVLDY